MYDSLEEIYARNNKYYQLFKFLEKRYQRDDETMLNPFEIFYNLPFYRFDLSSQGHLDKYELKRGRCCWNHFVGLPEKHQKKMPLFPYQKTVWEDFEKSLNGESEQKLFTVLKATGLGFTELENRKMSYLASSSNRFRGQRFAIIAGIRMNTTIEIIRRLVNVFRRFPELGIKRSDAKTFINGVMIEGYPAENVDSMRAYDNLAYIFVDEADFFKRSLQKEIRTVVERYIAKTNPFVYMVSTPNKPYGLFWEIYAEPDDQCIYKRYRFDWRDGLGCIFTQREINEQKKTPSFRREYDLQFGGESGNLFSENAIMKNIYSKEQAQRIEFFPYMFYQGIEDISNYAESDYYPRSIGLDPGFGRDPKEGIGSYTAITLTQMRNGRIEILYSQELRQPEFDELVDIVAVIANKTNTTKIFTDGSNPALVRALKNSFEEYPKYAKYTREEIEKKMYHGDMIVCPIPFNKMAKEMMFNLKEFVDKGLLVMREDQTNVIDCLKSAYVVNEKLDKERTAHDDIFDSLRLALLNYRIKSRVN